MQKVLEHGRSILGRILIIGMCVQILLGLECILANMVSGENRGVYLLQLLAAYISGYMLLHSLGRMGRLYKVLGAFSMLTVPMALQCHLTRGSNSWAISLLMLELAFTVRIFIRKESVRIRDVLLPHICWLLAGFIMREYMVFGGVPALVLTICWLKQGRYCGMKGRSKYYIACIVTMVSLLGAYIWQENGPLDNGDVTWKQAIVGRCIWSNITHTYENWPEEVKQVISESVVMEFYLDPSHMRNEFFDAFEEVEKAQANQYYNVIMKQTLQIGWKQLVQELLYDMAGYIIPGPVVDMQLDGKGYYSVTGMNYQLWLYRNAAWAGLTMGYYVGWFACSAIIAVLCFVINCLLHTKADEKKRGLLMVTLCGSGIMMLQACYYTITRIGMYDYKLAAWAAIMWCMLIFVYVNSSERAGC